MTMLQYNFISKNRHEAGFYPCPKFADLSLEYHDLILDFLLEKLLFRVAKYIFI